MASQPATPGAASTLRDERKRAQPGGRRGSAARRGEALAAYLFLTPYFIVLGIFYILVLLYGLGLSLFRVDIGFTAPEFVGLNNYAVIFQQLSYAADSDFWISLINIIKFTIVVVI